MVGLAIAALVLLLTFGSIVAAGPAARDRAVRPRHLQRADRPAGRGHGRARLGAGARVDARDRRRDRLRAADRHALPRGAGRRARAARGGRRGDRHRGPLGADRRHDRRDLAARPVPDGAALPLRRGARDDRRRARRDGGVGDARARAAGDRRARGSTGCGSPAPAAASPTRRATPAARWGRAVQRRPWVAAIAGVAVLLVLALPVRRAAARLPRPRQRRGRHDDPPGLRPGVAGLRARRERAAAARRADGGPRRARRMAALAGRAARRAGRRRRSSEPVTSRAATRPC